MKTPLSDYTVRVLMVGLGVVPTTLLTVYLGGFGLLMGIGALTEGEKMGAFFLVWVIAGVFGLIALGHVAVRFDAGNFRLRRWEASGIACGFLACIPFPYLVYPRGVFHLSTLWIYLPIGLSALAGLVVSVASAKNSKA